MMPTSKILTAFLLLLSFTTADAIILQNDAGNRDPEKPAEKSKALNCALKIKCKDVPEFPYWEHVGMVGMGTGIYLGDGWVLTSAHVGCYPFKMSDGSCYKPDYRTWRVFLNPDGGKADLAVYRVEIGNGMTSLSKLGRLPIGQIERTGTTPLVMIGTGLIERKKQSPISASEPILGYELHTQREKRWAFAYTDKVLKHPALTGEGYQTRCFVSNFRRHEFGGQAAAGDSGGAMFAFDDQTGEWALVGCIFAVSQLGTYVPFGSRTYLGDIDSYRAQLPAARCVEIAMAR